MYCKKRVKDCSLDCRKTLTFPVVVQLSDVEFRRAAFPSVIWPPVWWVVSGIPHYEEAVAAKHLYLHGAAQICSWGGNTVLLRYCGL